MPTRPVPDAGHHLRAWRDYRGLSQKELADRAGTTGGMISLLEAGKRGLDEKWARRLAEVLETSPGTLYDYDPADPELAYLRNALKRLKAPSR